LFDLFLYGDFYDLHDLIEIIPWQHPEVLPLSLFKKLEEVGGEGVKKRRIETTGTGIYLRIISPECLDLFMRVTK